MKNRLLLLLLPAGAGLVLWASFAISSLFSLMLPAMILLAFSLGFALQAVVLYLTRQRLKWLRFTPLALLVIPIVRVASVTRMMFGGLAAVLWLGGAVLYLIGWGAAWTLERREHG